MLQDSIHVYLQEIVKQFNSGHAREHTYRPALERLMMTFEDTHAANEPKRSEHGAPDFVFLKDSNHKIIKGYAEAKDIDVVLDKVEKTEQMERYHGYANLFLTNYLDFRFFSNGDKYKSISIGHVENGVLVTTPENGEALVRELKSFLELPPEKIKSGRRLAEIMGGKARRIRDNVSIYLGDEGSSKDGELHKIFEMMKKLLVHDLSKEKFADMYAQTLVYGLFVARYGDDTPESFTRAEARDLVPKSNPFLMHFFDHIVGPNFDTRLGYIVDELCEVFSVSNVQEIVHKHLRIQDDTSNTKDPIIHFYEDFLQEYDPAERKRMGAYYTPIPVVKFIVSQVDRILKEDFAISKGFASDETVQYDVEVGQDLRRDRRQKQNTKQTLTVPRVQVLDPAVGTATFLNETIKFIYQGFKGQEGRWPSYVRENLVRRLHGFELMMAPYTIAHLKLGMTLKETGVDSLNDRLGVYLTNTLEEGIPQQPDLFSFGLAEAVSEESRLAAEVKSERPVMVVMGNPPYSVESSNKTKYADSLIAKYRVEPGGKRKLQERNSKMLGDDYVKFIAFSEDMIQKNGSGIVAMITNNGYLDNPTFRGMRWHLAKTFNKIYVLDLHGNSKKKETSPDGGKDENVFDIMQGVGIILAVKTDEKSEGLADVYHASIYGKRRDKFDALSNDISFTKIHPELKDMYFVPRDNRGQAEYNQGLSIVDLFAVNTTGIKTSRDSFVIDRNREVLKERIETFSELSIDDTTIRERFRLKEVGDWTVKNARQTLGRFDDNKLVEIGYRPFDNRWTYWDVSVNSRMREKVFSNIVNMDNLCLATVRQQSTYDFQHAFIYDKPIDMCSVSLQTRETGYAFPLYIYRNDGSRTPNFNVDALKSFTINLDDDYQPEDILDYIYAMLHMPKYRTKYKEFLKVDFPRIPIPKNDDQFNLLFKLGNQLRKLHLLKHQSLGVYITTYPQSGSNLIEQVNYLDGKVYINNDQYFGEVPETAWNFYIGGYQPAQKWLKDRKGSRLSGGDIDHYQKMVKALVETDRIMKQIDSIA